MNRFLICLLLTAMATAQAQVFEVASIKPSAPGAHGTRIQFTGGRYRAENVTLQNLIVNAYDVRRFQVTGGPGWLSADGWDISAKPEGEIPKGPEGSTKMRAMMKTLLAERFGLVLHTETKELPVYVLVVGRNGHKLRVSAAGEDGMSMSSGGGTMKITKGTMDMFAKNLSSQLGRTVLDETGLKADFDFKLEFAPEEQNGPERPADAAPSDRPSLFTAVQEQLGLRLDSRKGPVQILVIEKAEKATEN